MMKHTSAELLEYEDMKRLIGRYVSGPLGRLELERVEPSTDQAALESALAEVAEATDFLRLASKPPLTGLVDTTQSIQKLRIEGAGLDGKEIADITAFLDRTTEVRALLLGEAKRFPKLADRAVGLADFRSLLREV